jgi:hypothetical protein
MTLKLPASTIDRAISGQECESKDIDHITSWAKEFIEGEVWDE